VFDKIQVKVGNGDSIDNDDYIDIKDNIDSNESDKSLQTCRKLWNLVFLKYAEGAAETTKLQRLSISKDHL
jgi:hypothetical protein